MDEACLLGESELDERWLQRRLDVGCNCSLIRDLNLLMTLHCESFPFNHELIVQLFYIFIFSAMILLALCGNFTVIWIVLCHDRMRTVTNYYLLNLAISDTMISIFNTGFSWSYNFYYVWIFGSTYCAISNLMGIVPICASVFTMIVMSIDRYAAIVHPLRRRLGSRATVSAILCIWSFAILCGLPALLASKQELNFFVDDNGGIFVDPVCLADNFPDGNALTSQLFALYNNVLMLLNYVLPLVVLIFTYGSVVMVLRKSETIGDTRHQESVIAKRRAANMLALVVFIFMFLWFPYQLYFSVLYTHFGAHFDRKTSLYIYLNIYWLGMSSTVFNPIIYYFMNERFRLGFRYAFRWIPCVHVTNDEYKSLLNTSRQARNSKAQPSRVIVSSHHDSPVPTVVLLSSHRNASTVY